MRHVPRPALLLPVLAAACGLSQPAARDRAAFLVCERLERCGELGEGRRYPSRQSCEVRQAADWDRIFDPEECEDRLDADALGRCLASIDDASCESLRDKPLLDTLVLCRRENVCTGGG